MVDISRRELLRGSGMAVGAALLPLTDQALTEAAAAFPLHKRIGEVPTICTYCAVGCGQIVGVQEGRVVSIEGDPDHPINRGRLCSKGMASRQIETHEETRQFAAEEPRGFEVRRLRTPAGRLTRVRYRAPGATDWEEKSWEWALDAVAARIKATRDATFVTRSAGGLEVNRTEAIGCLGGSQNTNEECYLLAKAMRALGIVYLEHQARI